MLNFRRWLIRAWDLETGSDLGRLNYRLMFLLFVVMVTSMVSPLLEALVRIFRSDYSASSSSLLALFSVFALALLLCFGGIAYLHPESET